MEYDYLIVNDSVSERYKLINWLNDGWTIDRATAVDRAVHYVLSRPLEPTDESSTTTTDSEAQDKYKPESLEDIPF